MFLGRYNIFRSLQGYSALFIVANFLVCWSALARYFWLQSTIPAIYQIIDFAHEMMTLIVFSPFRLAFGIFLSCLPYFKLIFLFIGLCKISNVSKIPIHINLLKCCCFIYELNIFFLVILIIVKLSNKGDNESSWKIIFHALIDASTKFWIFWLIPKISILFHNPAICTNTNTFFQSIQAIHKYTFFILHFLGLLHQ